MGNGQNIMTMLTLKGKSCPKCGKKSLSYKPEEHAFGWKDYSKVICRKCSQVFKVFDDKTSSYTEFALKIMEKQSNEK